MFDNINTGSAAPDGIDLSGTTSRGQLRFQRARRWLLRALHDWTCEHGDEAEIAEAIKDTESAMRQLHALHAAGER